MAAKLTVATFLDMGGQCPGDSAPDRPVRATGKADAAFTVTYCP